MTLLERLVNVIAPHDCIVCGSEGSLMCEGCWSQLGETLPSRCYKCLKRTNDSRVCTSCSSSSRLLHVWVRTSYIGASKDLVHKLKFERSPAAAHIVCKAILEALPELPTDTLVVPVPTTNARRRQRGFDQAVLIAKELSKATELPYLSCLVRFGQARQVGARRATRINQLQGAFGTIQKVKFKGKHVLLVDDVLTTGATLESAASTLRATGAKHVSAVVFAQA